MYNLRASQNEIMTLPSLMMFGGLLGLLGGLWLPDDLLASFTISARVIRGTLLVGALLWLLVGIVAYWGSGVAGRPVHWTFYPLTVAVLLTSVLSLVLH